MPIREASGPEYQDLAREEIGHYNRIFLDEDNPESAAARQTLFQPVPRSWIQAETNAVALVRQRTGNDLTGHLIQLLREAPRVRMLSLGSGPGGIELSVAAQARESEITCLDLNPGLMELGNSRAKEMGLAVRFETADLNHVELPAAEFDLVFCHASLHHLLELERIAEQIRKTLRPGGRLVVVDVISRNGYLMWPENRAFVQAIWKTLPERFRVNHTAYGEARVDAEIWEMDTSATSMECIRAEDITTVLGSVFQTEYFVPYFSLMRRFFDTMYGPNYDLDRALDTSIFNWIWQLDLHLLETGAARPETFFGIYRV